MKALYSHGVNVPFPRVLREHRAALVPLGILLGINVLVLLALVLPLSRQTRANEARALGAEQERQAAEAEYREAEGVREGKARASTDLDTFYKQVLPSDTSAARRLMQLKLRQLAQKHGIDYERGSTQLEEIRGSALERMKVSVELTGDYDDIRAFIYEVETMPDFVVIDNLVLAEGMDANAPLSFSLDLSTYYRPMQGGVAQGRTGAN